MRVKTTIRDLTVRQGVSESWYFQVLSVSGNTPVNIAGWSTTGQIIASFGGAVLTSLNAAITNAAQGEIRIALSSTTTAGLSSVQDPTKRSVQYGVYNVDVTDSAGNTSRAWEGRVTLSRSSNI